MVDKDSSNIPVLILGGHENALSILRSLSRHGIPVSFSATEGRPITFSRYGNKQYIIPLGADVFDYWSELLLGRPHPELNGHLIFGCGDDAVQFLAENREELEKYYLLDEFIPEIHLAMLDKKETLRLAKKIGIGTPRTWKVDAGSSIEELTSQNIEYPVIAKPVNSLVFRTRFNGKKYLRADNQAELIANLKAASEKECDVIISEFIPGPDTLLSSFYTYIKSDGTPLFQFTKRVLRRFPPNHGGACYHITDWDQETAELGMKFFQGIGLRGMANIEFKKDPRDNQLKVIECNPRFTAAHELLVRSGMDIAYLIHQHMSGKFVPYTDSFRSNMRLLYPVNDYLAFRTMRQKGEITFPQWIASLAHPQVFPFFRLLDPYPSIHHFLKHFRTQEKKTKG
ncbi:hypothetical protein [Candidatus Endoriftia persephone]|jgi:predicted ATP-grasp superfamily ATP-dependent carboligase|uniref:ATP-grasp protein-like protein n=3 Tax=Gammaproteobacteria TaxID=1236 RepID=G2FHX7_9GAMM|nr:hypothetical protein [Candidatus Endoriftia persephone]EGV52465.1 glycosyltransferase [endosymbiont of Riftia pachyptila (vent Ph05)]EGW53569.1 ATP-grasp protein-like protein [endosymbiont of Tevnia jerichonana (vent Tica)]USF86983.1 carboxylate--amine ligase [Candidatus Endoriftia persephone]